MMMTKSAAGKALKYLSLFPIAYLSLLAGASIVHNMYKPDLDGQKPGGGDHDKSR